MVLDPKDKKPVAWANALPANHLYPKEQALVDLYRQERQTGRRMLVFLCQYEIAQCGGAGKRAY